MSVKPGPPHKTYFDPDKPKTKPLSSWIESSGRKKNEIEEEAEDYEVEIITSGLNSEGARILQRFFGKKVLDYPKPPSLIRSLIRSATSADDVILDSFAGSGTTAQAILEQNSIDGGRRRFVLAQMPYDSREDEIKGLNICRSITAERVKKVIEGYSYKKRSAGGKTKQEKVAGLGGSLTYARLGPPLFNEYRSLGERLPRYEEIAKYVYYTETSREFDQQAMNPATGKIGEYAGTSYYLLYTPNREEDRDFNLVWLKSLEGAEANRHLVVYCEKIWVHRDDLAKYEKETGRMVRAMIVPFHLK